MPYIKNVPHEAIFSLADQVRVQPGQVVSKTLAQNDAVSVTLFAFAAGEEIGTHDSTGDAMVTVLEGVGQFTIDGVPYLVKPGEALVMPAKKPHSVYAPENLKWLLTVYVIAHIGQLCEILYVPFSVLSGRKPPTEIRYGLVDISVIIHSF